MFVVNIDECTDGADDCDENAQCIDTPGSFTCTCNTGYDGDGLNCTSKQIKIDKGGKMTTILQVGVHI